MKVSFDFDGTLRNNKFLIEKAINLRNKGCETFIITSRRTTYLGSYISNDDVFEHAIQVGIPLDHVIFTEGCWKADTLERLQIDFHYDDNQYELEEYGNRGYKNTNIIIIER